MKRQEKAKAVLETAKKEALVPVVGTGVTAYFDRQDIGSGWRNCMVIRVGRKFVTLFYFPKLYAFKLTHAEWALGKFEQYPMDLMFLKHWAESRVRMYDAEGIKYSGAETRVAQQIMEDFLANARNRTANRAVVPCVPHGAKAKPSGKPSVSTRRRGPARMARV